MKYFKQFVFLFCCTFLTVSYAGSKEKTSFVGQKGQRIVILKLDDVVDGPEGQVVSERWQRVTDFLEKKKIKSSFGVIGYSLVEDNPHYFQWVKKINGKGLVEFWNHGFLERKAEDPQGEFEKDYDNQLRSLQLTDSLAKVKLGITFRVWGPHWSGTNSDTDRALAQVPSIRMTFGAPDKPVYFKGIVLPRIIDLEYPTHNPDFEKFVAAYKNLKDKTFLSYLQGHPNSWDEQRWEQFVKIIDFLQSEGVVFVIPSEYYNILLKEKN